MATDNQRVCQSAAWLSWLIAHSSKPAVFNAVAWPIVDDIRCHSRRRHRLQQSHCGGALALAALGIVIVAARWHWSDFAASDLLSAGGFIWLAVDASASMPRYRRDPRPDDGRAADWVNDERLYAILDEVVAHPAGRHGSGDTKDRATLQVAEIAAREACPRSNRLEFALHHGSALSSCRSSLRHAGLPLSPSDLGNSVTVAVFVGFALGKPIGVFTFSWLAVRSGIALRPADL